MVVEGMGIIGHSRPTYRMTKVERAVYEINNNFNGIFYFLKPSDSPLEYAIDPGNLVPKSFFYSTSKKEDTINFVNEMYNSLKNEIKLMKDFKNRKGIVSISRKVDGVEIGRKLRFFRDILSTASVTNIESGYEIEKNEFTIELLNYISKKAQLTIDYLVSNKIIINNILYGFDNTFIKNIYFDKNGKTHSLSKFQMLELFTYREMNYLFYKIEISNFFFNDPAQCENELIFKTYLLAGRNYTHVDFLNDKRGLNEALKVKLNKELSPADIGWTNFKNYISTVVIKDIKLNSTHSIFNERILNNNSRHFINLGNKQVESFIHCNCYRELLYKSAGKFTSQDEELHQWLIAFERHDKAKQKKYVYTSNKLECQDKLVLSKPIPSSNKHILKAFEIIACGIKLVNGVAFQFSYRSITAPMYYYFIKDTPLELVYGKMAKNKIDFLLYENSVHAGLLLNNTTSLFDSNGNISDEFDSVILNQIDFNHLGINLL